MQNSVGAGSNVLIAGKDGRRCFALRYAISLSARVTQNASLATPSKAPAVDFVIVEYFVLKITFVVQGR